MSDSPKPRTEPNSQEQVDLPSLPDGGLTTNMPAWLKQAPAFTPEAADPQSVDPASLIEGVELPDWLNDLSQRVAGSESTSPASPADSVQDVAPTRIAGTGSNEARPSTESASTGGEERPQRPVVPVAEAKSQQAPPAEPEVEPPYVALALLVIFMGVAMAFIAMLVAIR